MGLVIGLLVGAGGMYLVLRTPWAAHGTPPAAGDQVAAAPSDASVGAKPKKKKRARRPGALSHRPGPGGEDEDWANSGGGEETEPQKLVQLSASDRQLEWRGDNTSPPKQTLDMSSSAESRSLENSEISSVISSQSGPTQACVVQAASNTDLSGTITVKMVVEGTGKVSRSRVQAPRYLHSQGVLSCIQRALRNMKFPATGAPTLVTLPVNLTITR
jgi:hypothetical protein